MVIHDESGLLELPPVIKKPLFEPKSQVIPENQDRNYEKSNENDAPMSEPTKKPRDSSENESEEDAPVSRKVSRKIGHSSYSYDNNDTISPEDLEELRSAYKKCRSVIKKIESKYGHLLNLNELKRKRWNTTDDLENECQCKLNKKIIFDDNGEEIAVDTVPSDHICSKKLRYTQTQTKPKDLQVEYNQQIQLPDSLKELKIILQNPELEVTYRNQVIQKMRSIKQEFAYDIKYNKRSIIDKLKSDIDEMLDFKGTNLSTITGYIY